MKLFINKNLDASSSSVISLTENNTKSFQSLFLGDVQKLEICVVDGLGNYDTLNATAKLSVAIGDLQTGVIYAQNNNLIYDTSTKSHTGNFVLSTQALATALDGLDQNNFTFEIQMDYEGNSVTIFNQLITNSASNTDGSSNNPDLLFAHFKCNELTEDGKAKDDSGNARHMYLQGTIAEGKFNNAYHFNGVTDYATLHSNFNKLGSVYSFSFWVMLDNPNSANELPILLLSENLSNDRKHLEIIQNGNQIRIKSSYSATKKFTTGINIDSNKWYHIAVVKSSDTNQEVYINGIFHQLGYNSNWGTQNSID